MGVTVHWFAWPRGHIYRGLSPEDQAINQITILQIVNTSTTQLKQEMKGKLTK